jgi:hypothetical protein
MSSPVASAPQEPHQGQHHQVDPNDDEQIGEINVIFGGSMSITLKTQEKKIQHEISLA